MLSYLFIPFFPNFHFLDVILRIILSLFGYSDILTEAAFSIKSKTTGGLRRIKSMSEFSDHKELMSRLSDNNLDSIIRNCPESYGMDIRMLCWLRKCTKEQLWVIGGGEYPRGRQLLPQSQPRGFVPRSCRKEAPCPAVEVPSLLMQKRG